MNIKVALCFNINYNHILNKEDIWKKWIEPNNDIINVYFFYKDITLIKSPWIKSHAIPESCIQQTSYYHVVPAYIALMKHALKNTHNEWFIFLTESCCPIISPKRFRHIFFNHYNNTIMSWKKCWWNIQFHTRANLKLLPEELRLANDAWFILSRQSVKITLDFVQKQQKITTLVLNGGLANESFFAIVHKWYGYLNSTSNLVINHATHSADWDRMASGTSPHLFSLASITENTLTKKRDLAFIEKSKKSPFVMFLRKVSPDYPDEILNKYIYDADKELDDKLQINYFKHYFTYYMKYINFNYIYWFLFLFYIYRFTVKK